MSANPAHRHEIDWRISVVRSRGMRAMGELLAARHFPSDRYAREREVFIERWADAYEVPGSATR